MAKPDWITVNPVKGKGSGSFNVTFAQNTSTSARSGIITVKTISGLTHDIQVTQAGKPANSLQASGVFCGIEIIKIYVPSGISQITFCVSLWCSNGAKIPAGHMTLTKGSQTFMTGDLSFDSSKVAFDNGVTVNRVVITCNPGSEPWATPFKKCIGSLDYDPGDMAFGAEGSSTTYPATFVQFSDAEFGFNIPTPVPISGDTTFVYKGRYVDDFPVINITTKLS